MTRPALAPFVVGVLILALVNGCDSGRDPQAGPSLTAAPTSSPSAAPAPRAAAALKALQGALADLRGITVSGATSGSPVIGRRRGVANLETAEFAAELALGRGGTFRMKRKSDLAWSTAPPWYWVKLGYTRASAEAARGKWVAAGAEDIKQLVASMDPGAAIRALQELDPADGVELGRVPAGKLRGLRVLVFRQAGAVQRVVITPGPRPLPVRITSTRSGVTTTIDVTVLNTAPAIRPPSADDVLTP